MVLQYDLSQYNPREALIHTLKNSEDDLMIRAIESVQDERQDERKDEQTNEQTDEQKKFVAGISTEKKVLQDTVTVLLLYKARHDCGKLQKGRVVLTSKKQEKQREGRRQHPPPGLEN